MYLPPEPLAEGHDVDSFESGEPALDDWLKRHARQAHAGGTARVFVSTTTDSSSVVAYYALVVTQIESASAIERARKGQPAALPVPGVLLARLAVDLKHQRVGLGTSLLQDVMRRSVVVGEDVGVKILLVHAKHEEARAWYEKYGFERSPTDPLHLMLLMKDVRRHLEGLASRS